jgi:predicted secreted protein
MAETQSPTVGYFGEFHLHNGTVLYELVSVKSFDIPTTGAREQVEVTDLKSPGWRREHVSTFYEDSDFNVVLNTRVLSDTDVLLADALADGDIRAFKAVIPENGVPTARIEGTCRVIGYDRGTVEKDVVITATVTLRVVTISAAAAGS